MFYHITRKLFYDIILGNKIFLGSKHGIEVKVCILLKILILPLSSCVIFDTLFKLPETQFPHF